MSIDAYYWQLAKFWYDEFMQSQTLTIKQIQKALNVSRQTVYDLIKDKDNPLPVVYIGEKSPRILVVDFNEWLKRQIVIWTDNGEEVNTTKWSHQTKS